MKEEEYRIVVDSKTVRIMGFSYCPLMIDRKLLKKRKLLIHLIKSMRLFMENINEKA